MKTEIYENDRAAGIFENADGTWLAMTYSKSKTFKTRKSALAWFAKFAPSLIIAAGSCEGQEEAFAAAIRAAGFPRVFVENVPRSSDGVGRLWEQFCAA